MPSFNNRRGPAEDNTAPSRVTLYCTSTLQAVHHLQATSFCWRNVAVLLSFLSLSLSLFPYLNIQQDTPNAAASDSTHRVSITLYIEVAQCSENCAKLQRAALYLLSQDFTTTNKRIKESILRDQLAQRARTSGIRPSAPLSPFILFIHFLVHSTAHEGMP